MKILHTADIHLRQYEDTRWKTLQRLVATGKQEKIDILVISGDLFDKDVDAENLRPMIRDIFSDNGFTIIVCPGNHDSESYKSGMYFGEDTHIITDIHSPYESNDALIWGMPFERTDGERILNNLHTMAKNFSREKQNILLYHGELLDAFFSRKDFGDEGEERYMPVKLSYFNNLNIDYVLAGHFHTNFNVRKLENGGYFVYPGSPVSITKREKGCRKVNIFETGKPPAEFLLDTPHYEEIVIELDPFGEENPLEKVQSRINRAHPEAGILLTVKGYFNGEKINLSESELVQQIKETVKTKTAEERFEFKNISTILEDNLFKSFMEKLDQFDYEEARKKELSELAIKALTESSS